ncbi:MAG: L-arabinose isomerase [Sedimentisphaerales bacterium]|nr:L-arabinose isomerase [Sedimentisphaerales bacterium]
MIDLTKFEVWFVTGSQHLYGPEALKQVADDSQKIVDYLNSKAGFPCKIVFKPTVKTPAEIENICVEANTTPNCIGIITWMHTFSPAKMWIAGLSILNKPFVHFHTQFNRDIPWDSIDMDFMNLNQSAHGGREFGFICSRMRKNRKVVVGHWQDTDCHARLDSWIRAAAAVNDWKKLKVARIGDNMREVAVTEGDKVEAQKQFGYSVNGYGIGDIVAVIDSVTAAEIKDMMASYEKEYAIKFTDAQKPNVADSAKIEVGMRKFMEKGGFRAFTTTFEDLHGLVQLPGLPVQRLMADGFGFGAEGDWKTSALVRAMKVMASGLKGGTSFMEDYTYHLDPSGMRVLGAHMLEVCPSISDSKPKLEVHPLGIGGKSDPARLVFNVPQGKGINVSVMDMGNRFRMLINPCKVVAPDADLPKLPVARVVWEPMPSLKVAAHAWILGGGAHHTGFSMALNAEHMVDFAEMTGIESLMIDENTTIPEFKNSIRVNEIYYMLEKGLR